MQKTNAPKISVAILAGGKSSRMKKSKPLLTYNGKTFLERLICEFANFDEILLSVKSKNQYEKCNFPSNVKIIADENQEKGALEGIRRVLTESKNDCVFVCAADMPFATKAIPEYLTDFASSDYDCYVLTSEGKPEPLCALYKKSVLPAITKQIQNNKLKIALLFDEIHPKFIPIEKSSLSNQLFLNVNTPEEYAALKKPFVFCVSGIKNSGKTRLILLILDELKKRGKTFAVIKHDGHDCFSDAEGTDTFRFSEQGTLATAIFSESRYMFSARQAVSAEDLINQIKTLSPKPDYTIIEGLKNSAYPKIEVLRKGVSEKSTCNNLICTASDFEIQKDSSNAPSTNPIPNFHTDDPCGILDCIERYFEVEA